MFVLPEEVRLALDRLQQNGFEAYLSEINPLSLLSATFPSCLEKAKDFDDMTRYREYVTLYGKNHDKE